MKKPIIAVDIDDVLADYAAGFVAFSNARWGTNLTVDDYDEHWAEVWKVDLEEVQRRADILHQEGMIGELLHKPDATPVLIELSKRFELIIVTARRTAVKDDTIAWIKTYYPMISTDKITFAGFWDTIDDTSLAKTKGDIAAALGAEYMIDDQFKHCQSAAEHGLQALLFGDYAWNQADSLPKNVTRVADWESVGAYFRELV